MKAVRAALPVALACALVACAPRIGAEGPAIAQPTLKEREFLAADGRMLAVHVWMPSDARPRAVVVAVHGFNDYGNFFAMPGEYLAARGIASYAYDQRGFGASPDAGLWPGTAALVSDLKSFVRAVRARHPGMPLYILGDSMGGAVLMNAAIGPEPPEADGLILVAPAVWGRATMPWYQRAALWLGAHTVPWMTVTGRGLGIVPSDNVEMLRALGRDPLVIKETRIDTIAGLVDLMDSALAAAAKLDARALVLYGRRDEIIPKGPTRRMLENLPASARARHRIAIYDRGYHMLLRDLQAETVWHDLVAWMTEPARPLPSGADRDAAAAFLAPQGAKD